VTLEIRPERPEDLAEIAALIRASFDQTDGAEVEMIASIRSSGGYIPELSLVATSNGLIVGYSMIHHVWLRGEHPMRVLDLGPVGVRPDDQRRGVGSALIWHGLERSRDRGEACVTCLGHESYYARFGFVPSERYGIEPFWEAMMVLPIVEDLEEYRGLRYPHEHDCPHEHDWTTGVSEENP
jgi:putative acetyltransferase